jgi:hypothetical protein
MKQRFEVLTKSGVWKYVFCRSMNSCDRETGNSIVPTENKEKAYTAHSTEGMHDSLDYFRRFAGENNVRFAEEGGSK